MRLHTQRKLLGTPSITDPKARHSLLKWILSREGVSLERSEWEVELDEVTVPAPLLESSSSEKSVPVTPTPISEEVNDDDHET